MKIAADAHSRIGTPVAGADASLIALAHEDPAASKAETVAEQLRRMDSELAAMMAQFDHSDLVRDKQQREKEEIERLEREKTEREQREEFERLEKERLEKERVERERLEQREEKKRLEKKRLEKERLEKERNDTADEGR